MKIGVGEFVRGLADVHLEHVRAGVLVRERNVDALIEPPPDRLVELVGRVGGGEDEDATPSLADALHLHENLRLDRRLASDSPPSPRAPHSASISSMKMMEGLCSRAIVKSWLTSFSDSPIHLDTRSSDEMEKNVESASVATALAR